MILRATVNVDASWCPQTHAGGWAAWIAIDGGIKLRESGRFKNLARTSEDAEFWAMLNGAWHAACNGASDLLVQGDCRGALRRFDANPQELSLIRERLSTPMTFRTKWVKGHLHTSSARHWVNDWCDKTAKQHMRAHRQSLKCR